MGEGEGGRGLVAGSFDSILRRAHSVGVGTHEGGRGPAEASAGAGRGFGLGSGRGFVEVFVRVGVVTEGVKSRMHFFVAGRGLRDIVLV